MQPTPIEQQGFTAEELGQKNIPPLRWIIQNLIPEGLTILAGKSKIGKSWFALDICLAKATGTDALGQGAAPQGTVLLLALEDSARRLQDRIATRKRGFPPSLKIYLEWKRLSTGGLNDLSRILEQTSYDLVVIDTFAKVKDMERPKTQELYIFDYEQNAKIKALADKHSTAIVLIHHLRKMFAADEVDSLNGSTGIAAGADTIMIMTRARGEVADATLLVTGRDIEERRLALHHTPEGWKILGEAAECGESGTRQSILALLRRHPEGLRPADIASTAEISPANVRQTLKRLSDDGVVKKINGVYVVS